MATHLKHTISVIYRENGLLTFLLFFIPLLPGFVELQTLVFANLIKILTGGQNVDRPAIKAVFGARGVKTLNRLNRQIVIPIKANAIADAFLVAHKPQIGFSLLDQLFTDNRQRQLLTADLERAKAINLLAEIIETYPNPSDQLVRSLYVHKIAALAPREQAMEPTHAIINVFSKIITQTQVIERQIIAVRQKNELNILAAQIKAELTGTATAGDPEFSFFTEDTQIPVSLFTPEDVNLMLKTLEFLKHAKTPEIALSAHQNLRSVNQLALN